jgi:hypothetical protein
VKRYHADSTAKQRESVGTSKAPAMRIFCGRKNEDLHLNQSVIAASSSDLSARTYAVIIYSLRFEEHNDPVARTALATMIASLRSAAIGALILMILFNSADVAFRDWVTIGLPLGCLPDLKWCCRVDWRGFGEVEVEGKIKANCRLP